MKQNYDQIVTACALNWCDVTRSNTKTVLCRVPHMTHSDSKDSENKNNTGITGISETQKTFFTAVTGEMDRKGCRGRGNL